MSTPNIYVSSIETNSPPSDPVGPVSGEASSAGAGAPKKGASPSNWLSFALFSIGGVAAIGLVTILFGAYLMEPENAGVIVAGTIVLMLSVIAWIVTALAMVGNLIWKMVTSRGNKPRRLPPQQQ